MGFGRHWLSRSLLLCALLWGTPSEAQSCGTQPFANMVIDIKKGVTYGVRSNDPLITSSPEDCVAACCEEHTIAGDRDCNLLIFDTRKINRHPNCYLFNCPSPDSCPMTPLEGIISYRLWQGVSYSHQDDIHLPNSKNNQSSSSVPLKSSAKKGSASVVKSQNTKNKESIAKIKSQNSMNKGSASEVKPQNSVSKESSSEVNSQNSVIKESSSEVNSQNSMNKESSSEVNSQNSMNKESSSEVKPQNPLNKESSSEVMSQNSMTKGSASEVKPQNPLNKESSSEVMSQNSMTKGSASEVKPQNSVSKESSSEGKSQNSKSKDSASAVNLENSENMESDSVAKSQNSMKSESDLAVNSQSSVHKESDSNVDTLPSVDSDPSTAEKETVTININGSAKKINSPSIDSSEIQSRITSQMLRLAENIEKHLEQMDPEPEQGKDPSLQVLYLSPSYPDPIPETTAPTTHLGFHIILPTTEEVKLSKASKKVALGSLVNHRILTTKTPEIVPSTYSQKLKAVTAALQPKSIPSAIHHVPSKDTQDIKLTKPVPNSVAKIKQNEISHVSASSNDLVPKIGKYHRVENLATTTEFQDLDMKPPTTPDTHQAPLPTKRRRPIHPTPKILPEPLTPNPLLISTTFKSQEDLLKTNLSVHSESLSPVAHVENAGEAARNLDTLGAAVGEALLSDDKRGLVAALFFGVVFLVVVICMISRKVSEARSRNQYTKLDYLINGMYVDT